MLYRRLKFSGGARKISYEHKISFQIAAEVKRKTQLHAPLDALHKIALFAQRSFAARMFAAALKFIYTARTPP